MSILNNILCNTLITHIQTNNVLIKQYTRTVYGPIDHIYGIQQGWYIDWLYVQSSCNYNIKAHFCNPGFYDLLVRNDYKQFGLDNHEPDDLPEDSDSSLSHTVFDYG